MRNGLVVHFSGEVGVYLVAGRVQGGVAVPALHLDTDSLAQEVGHHLLEGQVGRWVLATTELALYLSFSLSLALFEGQTCLHRVRQ